MEHLQRVWHASRERLPLRTPGSFPHCGTCFCSNCWDQIPRTCHVFTRLFTSITPWYFSNLLSRIYSPDKSYCQIHQSEEEEKIGIGPYMIKCAWCSVMHFFSLGKQSVICKRLGKMYFKIEGGPKKVRCFNEKYYWIGTVINRWNLYLISDMIYHQHHTITTVNAKGVASLTDTVTVAFPVRFNVIISS